MRDKRRDTLRALVAAPFALLPSLAACGKDARAAPPVGTHLVLPDLPLIDGGTFRAAEARGKVVAIYWWASWCPFCAEMSPHVEKLWIAQRERGLTVLGISTDRTIDAARTYRHKRGLTFPSTWFEPRMEPYLPKPKSIPVTWVRGRNGRIAMTETGQMFPEDVAGIARFL